MARFADGERKIVLFGGEPAHDRRHRDRRHARGHRTDDASSTRGLRPDRVLDRSSQHAVEARPRRRRAAPDLDRRGRAARSRHRPMAGGSRSPARRPPARLDRTQPDASADDPRSTARPTRMTWSADSLHLVALIDDDARRRPHRGQPDAAPGPPHHRSPHGSVAAYSNGRLFSAGPTGVGQVARDAHRRSLAGDVAHARRLRGSRARRDLGRAAGRDHRALRQRRSHAGVPGQPIASVAIVGVGPWIVAAATGRLLAVEPRRDRAAPRRRRRARAPRFITGDQRDRHVRRRARRSGSTCATRKATPLGILEGIVAVATAPDGAARRHRRRHPARAPRRRRRQPAELDGDVDRGDVRR